MGAPQSPRPRSESGACCAATTATPNLPHASPVSSGESDDGYRREGLAEASSSAPLARGSGTRSASSFARRPAGRASTRSACSPSISRSAEPASAPAPAGAAPGDDARRVALPRAARATASSAPRAHSSSIAEPVQADGVVEVAPTNRCRPPPAGPPTKKRYGSAVRRTACAPRPTTSALRTATWRTGASAAAASHATQTCARPTGRRHLVDHDVPGVAGVVDARRRDETRGGFLATESSCTRRCVVSMRLRRIASFRPCVHRATIRALVFGSSRASVRPTTATRGAPSRTTTAGTKGRTRPRPVSGTRPRPGRASRATGRSCPRPLRPSEWPPSERWRSGRACRRRPLEQCGRADHLTDGVPPPNVQSSLIRPPSPRAESAREAAVLPPGPDEVHHAVAVEVGRGPGTSGRAFAPGPLRRKNMSCTRWWSGVKPPPASRCGGSSRLNDQAVRPFRPSMRRTPRDDHSTRSARPPGPSTS